MSILLACNLVACGGSDSKKPPVKPVVPVVVDTIAPVITLIGDNPLSINIGTDYTEEGATVTDNVDVNIAVKITGNVDTGNAGTYTLVYDAQDAAGNTATSVSRIVNVIGAVAPPADTTPPIITLNGANPFTIPVGSGYVEPGAVVTDEIDQNISATITGNVDASKVGVYTLTYAAQDSSGNQAETVTRTVNVIDITAPTITLTGSASLSIPVGSTYIEQGAVVTDNVDENLTAIIIGNVDSTKTGRYTLTYSAQDSSGNQAESAIRTIDVIDITAPTITLIGNNTLNINIGSAYEEQGANVLDNFDNGLIVVISGSVDTSTLGSYTITYDAQDSSGNQANSITRTVNVVDTTAPIITLIGDAEVNVPYQTEYTEQGVTIADNVDTDLSVVITGSVDTTKLGSYIVEYNISDTAGNNAESVSRTVNVVDIVAPTITLNGNESITIEVGMAYEEQGVSIADDVDQDLTATISGSVDNLVVGIYSVTYIAQDSSGNQSDTITRTVNVVDTTAPIITLIGDSEVNVPYKTEYTEQGVTIADNVDTDLSVVITGSVDTTKLGSYIVEYNISDTSGNNAESVSRTVNVVDIVAPTVTLIGSENVTIEVGSTYEEQGALITDDVDQDLTATISGSVENVVVGTYSVTYIAQDSSGNQSDTITRTVNVVDTTAPVITLIGEPILNVQFGEEYTEQGVNINDNVETELTALITGSVDTSKLGIYILEYNFSDASGNIAESVSRTVNVIDTVAPTMTLNGEDVVDIFYGSAYVDEGVTVIDNVDEDLTASINGTVDTSQLGTYVLQYYVSDKSGNYADLVSRTINVIPSVGYLYGGNVEGLTYVTDTYSGYVGSSGEFTFLSGEHITFLMGHTYIGDRVLAKTDMSPIDLVNGAVLYTNSAEVRRVMQTIPRNSAERKAFYKFSNILTFLHTFDEDNNPQNGCSFNDGLSTLFNGVHIDFEKDLLKFSD